MTTTLDDPDTIDEAARLHDQAWELAGSGDAAAARERLERSVAMFEEACGPDHPDVANVLNTLGQVAQRQSDHSFAIQCYRRAYRIAARLTQANARDSMRPCESMSNPDSDFESGESQSLADASGCEDELVIARIAAQAIANLGNAVRESGDWVRAGRTLRRAVRFAREQLGPDDLDTANALNMLGMWCKFTGRFDLGRKCYRRALTIFRRHIAPRELRRSPSVACIYHNLGGLEHAAGNFAAGEPFARKSVAIRRRAVGTTHPDYASEVGALAAIVADLGRHDEAESLYREALAIFERAYGDDHYEIAVLLHNLAAVEVAREQLDSAWDLYSLAAEMKQRWLGPDHPDLALTLHNLAVLAVELDRIAAAATFCRQALTIFEANLVETHPTLAACRECWAVIDRSGNGG